MPAFAQLKPYFRSAQRLAPALILALFNLSATAPIARAQIYAPYLPSIDDQRLEQDANLLMEEARQLAQLPQQRRLAILRAKLATQLAPRNPDSWAILGGIYLLDNQAKASITALEKAKALAPKEPVVWFRLGSAYFQTKEYEKAISSLQTGLKIKPNIPSAMFDLGNAYLLNEEIPKAIEIYQKAYAQDSAFWFPLNNIGLIRYKQGDFDDAIRLWRACIAIDSREAEPKLALAAALYSKKGERFQAIRLASEAVKLNLRYSEPQYMRDNLWSEELIADTIKILEHPIVKAAIVKAQEAQSNIRTLR
ncbi:tetratricopeptide repeat protein [filamentous cyanobacterium LEGE 11480]|uniref:Tetratricopeptide repeat protein n=1 Tax=Romeriopsis navalis LEGE 11480 TaxID=2777977 RepID=A0A928VHB1_9CYAN|nr:tetratricopeptide repeat protein [Romeriopsis navalis]MBE9028611.1 tetratricopeptide repeat protein [Romeriopsis navalis LEGE 11480]